MIRKTWDEDKWLLTIQPEHARISGLIAVSWNFADNKPHDEVKKAIARHDDGWITADELPAVNRQGDPRNFDEMDPPAAIAIWNDSIKRLMDDGKAYGAALVAGHFEHLASSVDLGKVSPRQVVDIGKFIGGQRMLISRCQKSANAGGADATGTGEQSYARDLRLLQVCDLLSLLVCGDFVGEMEIPNVPYLQDVDTLKVAGRGDLNLGIEPLPFKKPLRGLLDCIAIPRRPYDSDEDLREEVSRAKALSREIHLGTLESAKIPNPGADK